jgi:uncharacterized protein (TIGR03435 family)
MLQALLEERFQLKSHRETREVPVYALVVDKNGAKLHRTEEGSCAPRDRTTFPLPPIEPGQEPCGPRMRIAAQSIKIEMLGVTMPEMAKGLGRVDRPVVDKTGLEGRFDIKMEYARNDIPPSDDPSPAPSIFTALREFGLKLEPAKGPREVFVIDHVDRPSEN